MLTTHAFRAAVEARDFDALPALFAADVVFQQPHRPQALYRGRDTVAIILRAVSPGFRRSDLCAGDRRAGRRRPCWCSPARVGDLDINGCDFLHRRRGRPHRRVHPLMLRPLAVTAFAEKMAVEFGKEMERAGLSAEHGVCSHASPVGRRTIDGWRGSLTTR